MAGTKMSGRRGTLAENVRRLRQRQALTITELAKIMAVSPSVIYQIENGGRRRIGPERAARLARVLRCELADLVG